MKPRKERVRQMRCELLAALVRAPEGGLKVKELTIAMGWTPAEWDALARQLTELDAQHNIGVFADWGEVGIIHRERYLAIPIERIKSK